MKLSDDLQKIITNVNGSEDDHQIDLLTVAKALERTYRYVNTSYLREVKDFAESIDDYYYCQKKVPDVKDGKVHYVIKNNQHEIIADIEFASNGDTNFIANPSKKKEAEEAITRLNNPSIDTLESMRMNAEVSFFSENRELILSKNPYLALKIGNYVDGDKAILVYHERDDDNEKNLSDGSIQYVRVDQVKKYLESLSVNERDIPVLAYANLSDEYYQELFYRKKNIEKSTYPKLTEEKKEYYQSTAYRENVVMGSIFGGMIGAFACGIFGTMLIGVVLPTAIAASISIGTPIVVSSLFCAKGFSNIRKAENKSSKIEMSKLELYGLLRKASNLNIEKLEKRHEAQKRSKAKKNPALEDRTKSSNPLDFARDVKKLIAEVDLDKASFYNCQLLQIINAYDDVDNLSTISKVTKDAEIYNRLSELTKNIIANKNSDLIDIINDTITRVEELFPITTTSSSLEILNSIASSIDDCSENLKLKDLERLENRLTKSYLKAIVKNAEVQTDELRSIPDTYQTDMLNYVIVFGKRQNDNLDIANAFQEINTNSDSVEQKLSKMLEKISDEDLIDELLENPKTKSPSKVKTDKRV